ncbi:type II toxin-antitoxin system VapC family toxin [Noviherbaspirillum suwonense]|uniref:Ribonuclease VapC n=1 Tax=Noviherbaspirillum suwonense TaxID=1224511 RepID=A0ABY1QMB3_9BURK|nr:type II toxin-antitoxin system VapC family toxin [Noviherbaspirillum suwonense]SMP73442.1 tRNA(fMet)-specific endonuclease VapC [Noviherbaspirillum suwonense]
MKYMLDTNTCIYLILNRPPEVLKRLEQQFEGDVVMSAITYAELRAGVEMTSADRARDDAALRALVARIPVQPFDEAGAEAYAIARKALPGRRRDAMDRLIAAHAASLDLVLVTNNEADFKDYPGIAIENWVAVP